jgi:hypothetical protein
MDLWLAETTLVLHSRNYRSNSILGLRRSLLNELWRLRRSLCSVERSSSIEQSRATLIGTDSFTRFLPTSEDVPIVARESRLR